MLRIPLYDATEKIDEFLIGYRFITDHLPERRQTVKSGKHNENTLNS